MGKQQQAALLSAGILAAITAGLGILFAQHSIDLSFITYRIVQNLRAGAGFAYNPGEPPTFNDAGSPIYALLLRLIAPSVPLDLPLLSNLLSFASIGAGGLALTASARQPAGQRAPLTALAAGALYTAFPILWIAAGLDIALWMAVCLIGLWLHLREAFALSWTVLALALVLRPEAAALIAVLAADRLITGQPLQPARVGVFAVICGPGLLWMLVSFGGVGPMPGASGAGPDIAGATAVSGLAATATALLEASLLWAAAPALALVGLLALREHRWAALMAGWAALHLIVLTMLGVSVYAWSLAPLTVALAALVALGGEWLYRHARLPGAPWALAGLGALAVVGAAVETTLTLVAGASPVPVDALHPRIAEPGYRQAGDWLATSTAPGTRVGTTHAGVLGYTAARPLILLRGSAEGADLPPRDGLSWIAHYAPEALVLNSRELESLDGYAPLSDPWFTGLYTESVRFPVAPGSPDAVVVFRRSAEPRPLTPALVSMVRIPGGLTLNRIATDFSLEPLEGGQTGMVSLEWLAGPDIEGEQYVALRIQSHEGAVAALGGRMLDFTGWPGRTLITSYHPLQLAPGLAPGVYEIAVGIGDDPFDVTWYPVARAKVPFDTAVFLGGISGVRADFGDIALLGYRLARTSQGLEVLLLWQALRAPAADYRVLIQMRDGQGGIASQMEGEPFGGAYPTSIWSSGEQVPDSYRVDITALPAGDYEVYAGLIDPDGSRLLTTEGQDAVIIGRVTIQP